MARVHGNFEYTVAVSREEVPASDGMNTVRGYVHQVYEQCYGKPAPDRVFYLCGWNIMVDEASQRLANLGYPPTQIIAELYG